MIAETDQRTVRQPAGSLLIASGLLMTGLMAHHPTAASGAAMIGWLHGAAMAAMLLMLAGFALFVRWRATSLALVGLVPAIAGAAAGLAAGVINGFIVPSLLGNGVTTYADLLWTSNQKLAEIGIVGYAAAYCLWSVDLWRLTWRVTAVLGVLAGLVPAALLQSGGLHMNIAGAFLSYSANAIWAVWLGIMLWRSRD